MLICFEANNISIEKKFASFKRNSHFVSYFAVEDIIFENIKGRLHY